MADGLFKDFFFFVDIEESTEDSNSRTNSLLVGENCNDPNFGFSIC